MNLSTAGYSYPRDPSPRCKAGRPLAALMMFGIFLAGPGFPAVSRPPAQALDEIEQLESLYSSRHFFALEERLGAWVESPRTDPRIGFYLAAVHAAFNRSIESNAVIRDLRERADLDVGLSARLLRMELENDLRTTDYADALATAKAILSLSEDPLTITSRAYAQRMLPLLIALEGTPRQTVEKSGFSRLALGRTRRIPIEISGKRNRFALDTGANFSVIMTSEAKKLGLEIRTAGLRVATSTDKVVLADVAIAREVVIGKVRYQNVVFLVLPDGDLSLAGRDRIAGLIGFPIVSAMEEIRFRRDDVLEIPQDPAKRTNRNLALNDLEPLVRARYSRDDILCRLDTGAEKSDFYEPFFRRYRERIEDAGKKVTAKRGGVGGYQDFAAYRLPRFVITVAGLDAQLRNVDVLTQPVRSPPYNFLDCNLGRDVLEQFPAYVLNFRDMALILE
ncbi:MAG: retropepsin-like aspartic protease [Acidobacteriota bacterium]